MTDEILAIGGSSTAAPGAPQSEVGASGAGGMSFTCSFLIDVEDEPAWLVKSELLCNRIVSFAPAAPQSEVGAAGSGFIHLLGSVESPSFESGSPAEGSPDVRVSVSFGSSEGP